MAARKTMIKMDDRWKEKIGISMIINRLCDHVHGKIELSPTQISAANILLKKVAPDLASTTIQGTVQHNYVIRSPQVADSVGEWKEQNPQVTLQ